MFYPADTRESTYFGTGFLVDLMGLVLAAELEAGCPETSEGLEGGDSVTVGCFGEMFKIYGQSASSNIC